MTAFKGIKTLLPMINVLHFHIIKLLLFGSLGTIFNSKDKNFFVHRALSNRKHVKYLMFV